MINGRIEKPSASPEKNNILSERVGVIDASRKLLAGLVQAVVDPMRDVLLPNDVSKNNKEVATPNGIRSLTKNQLEQSQDTKALAMRTLKEYPRFMNQQAV